MHFLVWGQLLIALKHGACLVDFCSSLGACYKKRVARPQTCCAVSGYEWVNVVLYSHTKGILEGFLYLCSWEDRLAPSLCRVFAHALLLPKLVSPDLP